MPKTENKKKNIKQVTSLSAIEQYKKNLGEILESDSSSVVKPYIVSLLRSNTLSIENKRDIIISVLKKTNVEVNFLSKFLACIEGVSQSVGELTIKIDFFDLFKLLLPTLAKNGTITSFEEKSLNFSLEKERKELEQLLPSINNEEQKLKLKKRPYSHITDSNINNNNNNQNLSTKKHRQEKLSLFLDENHSIDNKVIKPILPPLCKATTLSKNFGILVKAFYNVHLKFSDKTIKQIWDDEDKCYGLDEIKTCLKTYPDLLNNLSQNVEGALYQKIIQCLTSEPNLMKYPYVLDSTKYTYTILKWSIYFPNSDLLTSCLSLSGEKNLGIQTRNDSQTLIELCVHHIFFRQDDYKNLSLESMAIKMLALLEAGAILILSSFECYSLLAFFISAADPGSNCEEMAEILLALNPNIKVIDKEGNTPFHRLFWREGVAGENKLILKTVQLFLLLGADIKLANHENRTPFDVFLSSVHYSQTKQAKQANEDILIYLLNNHISIDELAPPQKEHLLAAIMVIDSTKLLEFCLKKTQFKPNELKNIKEQNTGNTLIHIGAQSGSINTLHYFFQHELFDATDLEVPNKCNQTPYLSLIPISKYIHNSFNWNNNILKWNKNALMLLELFQEFGNSDNAEELFINLYQQNMNRDSSKADDFKTAIQCLTVHKQYNRALFFTNDKEPWRKRFIEDVINQNPENTHSRLLGLNKG